MLCEMCGKSVTFCKKVMIEGVSLQVCAECAKFGKEAQTKPKEPEGPKPIITQRLELREKRSKPKDVLSGVEREELVEDYPARIRNGRSRIGLSQKDLAMKLNEKVGILQKVENGDLRPDERLITKLQKELGIVLKEKVTEIPVAKESVSRTLTLADLIKIKEK